MSADMRLATYGTLSPGRTNHHQLAELTGTWFIGTVRGNLIKVGWGAALGYPGIILDPAGPDVEVHILESADLQHHWPRLDAFEGAGYQRVMTKVTTQSGDLDVYIYEVRV